MSGHTCVWCRGPAVVVEQTGDLSCVRQCRETPRDELVRKELEGLTRAMAELVAAHMPKGFVFTIILANAESGARRNGVMAYASTAQRADNVSMLREMAEKIAADAGRPS